MLIRLLAGTVLGLAVGFVYADEAVDVGGTLVDDVLAHPGFWDQMCSPGPPPKAAGIYGSGFERPLASYKITDTNFIRLREHRAEVLSAISERLDRARTDGIASIVPPLESHERRWGITDADCLEMLLVMLLDLNGIEAMPALLRYEKSIAPEASYERTEASLHPATSPIVLYTPITTSHMHVLSTIAAILVKESPDTVKSLDMFAGRKTTWAYASYSKENRDTLIEATEKYLAETDEASYKGAAGMDAKPKRR